MEYFLLFLLPFLSALKVFIQGKTAKRSLNTLKDCFLFTGLVSLFSALLLSAIFLRALPQRQELLYALLYAIFSTAFQFFYILSFRSGPVSVSSTVTSFAVVLPILFGVFAYHTTIGLFGYLGFAFMAVSFLLVPDRKKGEDKKGRKWIFYLFTLLAFLFSGLTSTMQVVVSRAESCDGNAVIIFSYYFSALMCCISALTLFKQKTTMRFEKNLYIGIPLIAICLGLYNLFSVIALKKIPETVFYTVVPGSHLVIINVLGLLFLKEKKTAIQYIGILFAIVAVVLTRV